MAKVSQRTKKIHEKIEPRAYKAIEALELLKEYYFSKLMKRVMMF